MDRRLFGTDRCGNRGIDRIPPNPDRPDRGTDKCRSVPGRIPVRSRPEAITDLKVRYILVTLNAFLLCVPLHFPLHSYGKACELDKHESSYLQRSPCELNLKLWVLGIAKILVRPGSEGTIYFHYFECISV